MVTKRSVHMSMDILIRGARTVLCNGAYSLFVPEDTVGYNRIWLAYDKLCVIKTEEIDGVLNWVIRAADYNTTEQTISDVASIYYYKTPVQISEEDTEVRDPWDSNYVWEPLIADDNSVISIVSFHSDHLIVEQGEPTLADDGSIVTIIKYTNILTGDTWRDTSIVRQKTVPVISNLERFTPVKISTGKVYRFQFTADFAKLGYEPDVEAEDYNPFRGIYRIEKILSYNDILSAGIDIYEQLYATNGVSYDVYKKDVDSFADSTFYRLSCPGEMDKTFYIPDMLFKTTPTADIDAYDKLMLTIDLGIYSDPDMLVDLQDIIEKLLEKKWGITSLDGEPLVRLAAYDKVWMHKSDYAALDMARKDKMKESLVNLADMFCATENNAMYRELQEAKAKILAYEEIIVQGANL